MTTDGGRVFREAWITGVRKNYPGQPKPSYVTPWDDTPEWERASASAVHAQARAVLQLTDNAATKLARGPKGKFVAVAWAGQILKHVPNPKPGYVTDWDDLPDWQGL